MKFLCNGILPIEYRITSLKNESNQSERVKAMNFRNMLLGTVMSLSLVVGFATQVGAAGIHEAIKNNNVMQVRALIEDGVDLEAVEDTDGRYDSDPNMTALNLAVRNNRLDIVKLLLEANAKVNRGGFSALHLCADPMIGEELIRAGADVNSTCPYGDTALTMSARLGNLEMVRMLLQQYGIIDTSVVCAHNEMDALTIARKEGYGDIARLIEDYIFKATRGHKTKSARSVIR